VDVRPKGMSVTMSAPRTRPRQFKLYLSDEEWHRLDYVMEVDGCSAADALRGFIHSRYEELDGFREDPYAVVDALVELARRIRSLARRGKLPLRAGP